MKGEKWYAPFSLVDLVHMSLLIFLARLLHKISNRLINIIRNYSGLLQTCQRKGNRLRYIHDERRRSERPARKKSNAQSIASSTAPVERAVSPSYCANQGAGRARVQRQSHQQ